MKTGTRPKIRLGDKAIVACGLDDFDWRLRIARLADGTWSHDDLRNVTRSIAGAPCRNGECDSTVSERKAVTRALARLRTVAHLSGIVLGPNGG